MRQPLSFYLDQCYPYTVMPDPDGGFFLAYPDLPGCMTQVSDEHEIPHAADEIRALWLESAFAHGMEIPLPRANVEYSGKFLVRVPRSLHHRLAESAAREEVSLNQYVVSLLSMNDANQRIEHKLDSLERKVEDIRVRLRVDISAPQLKEPTRLTLVVPEAVAV
jgi:predicted RNase H-like HicB family nuclease